MNQKDREQRRFWIGTFVAACSMPKTRWFHKVSFPSSLVAVYLQSTTAVGVLRESNSFLVVSCRRLHSFAGFWPTIPFCCVG
jgi:hypothetical protein